MSSDGGQDHLNGHSAVILAAFCIVSFFVIFPVKIPLPGFAQRPILNVAQTCRIINAQERKALGARRLHLTLSLLTAPLIAVIVLLATTTIHGSTIRLGIVGDENVKPYEVLVLFISLVSRHLSACSTLLTTHQGLHIDRPRWYWRPRSSRLLGLKAGWKLRPPAVLLPVCFLLPCGLHRRQ